ncbi:hypothetical protein L3073_19045 [Ancylomarina sp. DW003]|nr:hypothetical protein [Ancylomarina sp. DW003]MDE5424313.1 hypothetical protein [Ancylomarina sp. DW003]
MYNSAYRIYTIAKIEEVITGKYIDPTFIVTINTEEYDKLLKVKYPYFKKPAYLIFDPFKEDNNKE